MFFEIGSLKNLAAFSRKQLCGVYSNRYCEILKNSFFYRKPPVAASDCRTTVKQSQLGCLFFDFAPPRTFDFD